jgi:LPS sulfotransferase NodH
MNIRQKTRRKLKEWSAFATKKAVENHILPGNNAYTRFVIITDIRSGSTMLGSYLSSHPAVVCFFEVFHYHRESIPFGVAGFQNRGNNPTVVALRNNDPVKFLQTYIFNRHLRSTQAVGFKLLYTQAHCQKTWWHEADYNHWWRGGTPPSLMPNDKANLWQHLQMDDQLVVIHLIRRNYLARLISFRKACLTGNWGEGATGGHGVDVPIQIDVDPSELRTDLEAVDRFERETDKNFAKHKVLKIAYEDLVQNATGVLSQVTKTIGISELKLSTKSRKQNTQPLRGSIRNFEELRKKFIGTKWEYLFAEE